MTCKSEDDCWGNFADDIENDEGAETFYARCTVCGRELAGYYGEITWMWTGN